MTLGQQAALGLLAVIVGWIGVLNVSSYVPGMKLDKLRPALEAAAAAALSAALPLLPDLLADEPVVTPRQVARAALSAACGVFLLFRKMSEPAKSEGGK